MSINYNEVTTGELFKWKEKGHGTVVEGVLVNYESKTTPKGEANLYEVRTKNGMISFFAPQLLHKKLKSVGTGNIVRIEFTKTTKTGGGNDLHHFDVKFAPADEANLKTLGIEIFKDIEDSEEAKTS